MTKIIHLPSQQLSQQQTTVQTTANSSQHLETIAAQLLDGHQTTEIYPVVRSQQPIFSQTTQLFSALWPVAIGLIIGAFGLTFLLGRFSAPVATPINPEPPPPPPAPIIVTPNNCFMFCEVPR